jgi:hypothetical protein
MQKATFRELVQEKLLGGFETDSAHLENSAVAPV